MAFVLVLIELGEEAVLVLEVLPLLVVGVDMLPGIEPVDEVDDLLLFVDIDLLLSAFVAVGSDCPSMILLVW